MSMNVPLVELEPQWIVSTDEGLRHVDSLEEAEGIMFLCPKCYVQNGGAVGTHAVICWSPQAPDSIPPGPGRWTMSGTDYGDLTLMPSVQITSGCMWHGFVKDGEATL